MQNCHTAVTARDWGLTYNLNVITYNFESWHHGYGPPKWGRRHLSAYFHEANDNFCYRGLPTDACVFFISMIQNYNPQHQQ